MSDTNPQRLAHLVFFTLKEQTDEARQRLVDACQKWLADAPGLVFFGVGLRGEEFQRPVNDTEYDVGLHVVFESKESHDQYQTSEAHQAFLAENKETFASLKVYDTYL